MLKDASEKAPSEVTKFKNLEGEQVESPRKQKDQKLKKENNEMKQSPTSSQKRRHSLPEMKSDGFVKEQQPLLIVQSLKPKREQEIKQTKETVQLTVPKESARESNRLVFGR